MYGCFRIIEIVVCSEKPFGAYANLEKRKISNSTIYAMCFERRSVSLIYILFIYLRLTRRSKGLSRSMRDCKLTCDRRLSDSTNFQVTRASPFLQKPSDFNLSIVRFSLDTYNLPVFIPIIDDPDKAIYTFLIKYDSKLYSKNIIWKSPNQNISKPSKSANNFQDYNSNYYYCFTFTYFVNLINDEIIELFEKIKNDTSTENFDIKLFHIKFNSDFTFSIFLNYNSENLEIYFNNGLYSLFSSYTFENIDVDSYKLTFRSLHKPNHLKIF